MRQMFRRNADACIRYFQMELILFYFRRQTDAAALSVILYGIGQQIFQQKPHQDRMGIPCILLHLLPNHQVFLLNLSCVFLKNLLCHFLQRNFFFGFLLRIADDKEFLHHLRKLFCGLQTKLQRFLIFLRRGFLFQMEDLNGRLHHRQRGLQLMGGIGGKMFLCLKGILEPLHKMAE